MEEQTSHLLLPSSSRQRHGHDQEGKNPSPDLALSQHEEHPHEQANDILRVIRNSPNYTLTPARLSSALGISIEDASAELCGLLRAVGSTASFRFESLSLLSNNERGEGRSRDGREVLTMVFQFPPDFEEKAYSAQWKESVRRVLWNIVVVLMKILKVVVAFGLVLSLVILTVGGLCALVAAAVIMARGGGGGGGGHRHHQRLAGQMRSMLLTLRQLLWFYVIFGDGLDQLQDPFMRETAHTLALGLNLFLGSPRSIWFWWNAQRLRERQRRGVGVGGGMRCSDGSRWHWSGWRNVCGGGGRGARWNATRTWRDSWREEVTSVDEKSQDQSISRNIVSVAAEFLFGPTPFWPPPTLSERWKIREHFIVAKCTESAGKGLNLYQLLPFTDEPPFIRWDGESDVEKNLSSWDARMKCLQIVSHFNGVAVGSKSNHFVFPELMAEATSDHSHFCLSSQDDKSHPSWRSFFHACDSSLTTIRQYQLKGKGNMDDTPEYLYEERHVLTELNGGQFSQCALLNILNYIGILMLRTSISEGGALEIPNATLSSVANAILSVLEFYARLFFAVPLGRGLILVLLNYRLEKRNQRRKNLAQKIAMINESSVE